jgi:hypothetical protein
MEISRARDRLEKSQFGYFPPFGFNASNKLPRESRIFPTLISGMYDCVFTQ